MGSDTNCWTQYGLNNFFLRNMASDFSICEKDVRKWKSDFQKQDLQNYQVYITLKQNSLQGDCKIII